MAFPNSAPSANISHQFEAKDVKPDEYVVLKPSKISMPLLIMTMALAAKEMKAMFQFLKDRTTNAARESDSPMNPIICIHLSIRLEMIFAA